MNGARHRDRRGRRSAALALLLVCAGGAPAAELYKWVDDAGNTHFSQTPPPDAAGRARDVDAARRGAGGLRAQAWYGEVDGRIHRLDFGRDGFELVDRTASVDDGSPVRLRGSWTLTDGRLALRFRPLPAITIEDPHAFLAKRFAGRRFTLPIAWEDDRTLQLGGNNPAAGTWFGHGPRRLYGAEAEQLVGDWLQQSDGTIIVSREGAGRTQADIDLRDDGSFELDAIAFSQYGMKDIDGIGRWRYKAPFLRLRFLEVRHEDDGVLAASSLREERWEMEYLGRERMRLRNTRNGRVVVYARR